MKQKIVIQVQMNCDKCRTKAKKIAATADGVASITLDGAAKDKIVVIGDEVDSVKLATSLRKKVGPANIMSVQEEKDKGKDEKKGSEEKYYPSQLTSYHLPYINYPQPPTYEVVCDPNPNTCTIF